MQFAAVLCSKIQQDPSLLPYILEVGQCGVPGGVWAPVIGILDPFCSPLLASKLLGVRRGRKVVATMLLLFLSRGRTS